jgi:hypothetical protein
MSRTFHSHQHKSSLHGLTVVLETEGDEVWVGRCDDEDEERVILLDADVHRPGTAGDDGAAGSREEWLAKAVRFGVWPHHRRVVIPRGRVQGLRLLNELG